MADDSVITWFWSRVCNLCIDQLWNRSKYFYLCINWDRPSSSSYNMSRPTGVRLFEDAKHANAYAQYRPTYGQNVTDAIIRFCQEGPNKLGVAIDVGCGSGQSTRILSNYFERVIGIDISAEQINQVKIQEESNTTYKVAAGEDFSFQEDDSTDLVTCAVAFHWLNQEVFFKEVDRVLRPGGSLIVYGYDDGSLTNTDAQKCFEKNCRVFKGPFSDDRMRLIDNKYRDVNLGYPGWTRNDALTMEEHLSVDAFVGYISSWSQYQAYAKKYPDNHALEDLKEGLQIIYYGDGDKRGNKVHVVWSVFMLMGRKPTA